MASLSNFYRTETTSGLIVDKSQWQSYDNNLKSVSMEWARTQSNSMEVCESVMFNWKVYVTRGSLSKEGLSYK